MVIRVRRDRGYLVSMPTSVNICATQWTFGTVDFTVVVFFKTFSKYKFSHMLHLMLRAFFKGHMTKIHHHWLFETVHAPRIFITQEVAGGEIVLISMSTASRDSALSDSCSTSQWTPPLFCSAVLNYLNANQKTFIKKKKKKNHWQGWEISEIRFSTQATWVVLFVLSSKTIVNIVKLFAVRVMQGGSALTSSPSSPPGMHISESLSCWSHACSEHLQEKKQHSGQKLRLYTYIKSQEFSTLRRVTVTKYAVSHITNLSFPPHLCSTPSHNLMLHNASVASLLQ